MRLGLRAQLLLASSVLLALALWPLTFVVRDVHASSLQNARMSQSQQAAEQLAEAWAQRAHDGAASTQQGSSGDLGAHVELSVCVREGAAWRALRGEVAWCEAPAGTQHVVAQRGDVRVRAPLLGADAVRFASTFGQLLWMYIALFGLGWLLLSLWALTWLVVRPIESLATAAQRVALGAEAFVPPPLHSTELRQLARDVQGMAAKLRQNEAELATQLQRAGEASQLLTSAQRELAAGERLASVGRLAAGVAHEIGNPLTAMIGLAELIADGSLEGDVAQDFARRIAREGQRAHATLGDLLLFAREGQPARGEESAEPARLLQVCEQVRDLLAPQPGFRHIALRLQVPEAARLHISAPRLMQVLVNLALNAHDAIHARPERPGEGVIELHATRDGESWRVEVRDDGPGVPPALRESVFEPFVTSKEPGHGTGLGLSVCRGLLAAAGGSLQLLAGTAPGACFVVRVPAA